MFSHVRRLATAGMLAVGLVAAPAGAAHADPKGDTFAIECENGLSGTATTSASRGAFTPAHLTDSTAVVIPVSFLSFTGTVLDADGDVVGGFSQDEVFTKGSGKQRGLVLCTARFDQTVTLTAEEAEAEGLPGAGTYRFLGTGEVLAQVRGR